MVDYADNSGWPARGEERVARKSSSGRFALREVDNPFSYTHPICHIHGMPNRITGA
jgi:hypothetical protein